MIKVYMFYCTQCRVVHYCPYSFIDEFRPRSFFGTVRRVYYWVDQDGDAIAVQGVE